MIRMAFSHGEEEYEKRSIREHLAHQRTMRLMLSDDWKCGQRASLVLQVLPSNELTAHLPHRIEAVIAPP